MNPQKEKEEMPRNEQVTVVNDTNISSTSRSMTITFDEAVLNNIERKLALPPDQITLLLTLIDIYGENYLDMAKDPLNVNKLTWEKLRIQTTVIKGLLAHDDNK